MIFVVACALCLLSKRDAAVQEPGESLAIMLDSCSQGVDHGCILCITLTLKNACAVLVCSSHVNLWWCAAERSCMRALSSFLSADQYTFAHKPGISQII